MQDIYRESIISPCSDNSALSVYLFNADNMYFFLFQFYKQFGKI